MFGVSYKTNANDVKIHSGLCRFTRNQSQAGTTKWENHNELGLAVRGANRLSGRNQWRYAQCCLRKESYVYECGNCSKLTRGKRFVSKKAMVLAAYLTFGFGITIAVLTGVVGPNNDPLLTQIQPIGNMAFVLGIIVLPIVYFVHPKRCSNCRIKEFRN